MACTPVHLLPTMCPLPSLMCTRVPFNSVPCCVFPVLFPHRSVPAEEVGPRADTIVGMQCKVDPQVDPQVWPVG